MGNYRHNSSSEVANWKGIICRRVMIVLLLLGLPIAMSALAEDIFPAAPGSAEDPVQFLRAHGTSPEDYVLAKGANHRVVILGENHWIKHDVELVARLVPSLRTSGVTALAVEVFVASDQTLIDQLVTSDNWDAAGAMRVMRNAEWPYREYLEIIHAVWTHNHNSSAAKRLRLLALGPGSDWRDRLLPLGQTYDTFMARLVSEYLKEPEHKVLVYEGGNHAFTRYHQPEAAEGKRVRRFMDRTGNVLWREFGEEVFTVSLHRPWQCRAGNKWSHCLPLSGAIDCAAAALKQPVGFDVAGSPFADLSVPPEFYYGMGYPSLRFGDIADGYIWTKSVPIYEGVSLIPLSEFAPDKESMDFVTQHNPVSDAKGLGRPEMEAAWKTEAERLRQLPQASGWGVLSDWQARCK